MGFEAFVDWFEGLMVLYWKGGIFTEKVKVKDYWYFIFFWAVGVHFYLYSGICDILYCFQNLVKVVNCSVENTQDLYNVQISKAFLFQHQL